MKKTARVLKIGLTIFLFGALPLVILTLITSKSGVLNGIRSFTVLSGSMEPALPIGSLIYTHAQTAYELGDVVSVKNGNVTVTHRIYQTLQKNGTVFYKLKGDANKSPDDSLVTNKDIVGKQVAMIPVVGRFSAFLKTVEGFLLFIVLPAVVLVGFEIFSIKKELEIQIESRIKKELGLTT